MEGRYHVAASLPGRLDAIGRTDALLSLVTSLRTSDSLTDNESYFFAELKRLKLIIDKLKAGECLFIILDEILKGTNSTDKQKGSLALIRQFMSLQANGIIATHDLPLGTLAVLFPDRIRNYRFEADITGDMLTATACGPACAEHECLPPDATDGDCGDGMNQRRLASFL